MDNYDNEKKLVIVMLSIISYAMTRQHKYHEKTKKITQRKVKGVFYKMKNGFIKSLVINAEHYLKKRKQRKETLQEIDTRIGLPKQQKTNRKKN